jgi:hypothetical protein
MLHSLILSIGAVRMADYLAGYADVAQNCDPIRTGRLPSALEAELI